MKEQDCQQQQLNRRKVRKTQQMKKKTTQHKTRHSIAWFSQLVGC
jgi:hypothetical protein